MAYGNRYIAITVRSIRRSKITQPAQRSAASSPVVHFTRKRDRDENLQEKSGTHTAGVYDNRVDLVAGSACKRGGAGTGARPDHSPDGAGRSCREDVAGARAYSVSCAARYLFGRDARGRDSAHTES